MPTRSRNALTVPLRALLIGVLTLTLCSPPAQARNARIVSVTETSSLPVIRPDTPVPNDAGQVLYLQRSTNRNTVVYVANFDAVGNLDSRNPISVYWRRYEEQGQTRALNLLERKVAYGLRIRPGADPDSYRVNFRAVEGLEMTLRQSAPFKAALYAARGDVSLRLIYGHIEVIDGLTPQVIKLQFFGKLPNRRHATVVLVPE